MTELTREEWGEVARILGEEASDIEEIASSISEIIDDVQYDEEHDREYDIRLLERMKVRAQAFRNAAAAVLWVSEYAADKVRFMMLDGHPPDGE